MRQSNVSEALAYYEKAVDMYAERGFLNNAIALCNKILRQSPARTNVYYKLGRISASKGFKSDARKNFLEYADRMQKGGNIDEAFRALKEFADLCPDQDDIRLFLADLLTKEQRTDEAVDQLERLYAKLEAEGRSAEARATMDRIKAIDPDITPKPSGSFISQKTNDLVFLDLNEPGEAPVSASPLSVTPVVDPPVAVDVSGVGALEGLAITFFPEEGGAVEAGSAPVNVDGLELNAVEAEPVDPAEIAPLDVVGSEEIPAPDPLEGIEIEATASVEDLDIVTPVEGLASITTTITGTHPSLAPLLEAPPMSGEEFGHLELEIGDSPELPAPAHDLALPSSLPRLEAGDSGTAEPASLLDDAPPHENAAPTTEHSGGYEAQRSGTPATVEPVRLKAAPAASDSELAAVQSAHDAEQVEDVGAGSVHPHSALDTSTLGDAQRRGTAPLASPELSEGNPRRSSFEEDRVELPLLDLEAQANASSDADAFDDDALPGSSIDDLLAAPPTFGDSEEPDAFDPAPLDLAPQPSTEEWEQPEVLIDGEWRDEHVGDLVSGEMFVIGERRQATRGPNDGGTFDDLAAAMMYDEEDVAEEDRKSGGGSKVAHRDGRTSTLSFGGTEAQLRLRLESDPGNPALRRQLGEALLDDGHREEGLNELEQSVLTYESQAAFASAREVVDVILRVAPLSVHHHQKRVEYAVRANDRVQLIGAYTELADALFRCGESEKSRVVYARVLDLDPENDRARFALGILSEDSVALRSSDEIPTIDTGIAAALPPAAPEVTPVLATSDAVAPRGYPATGGQPLPDEPHSSVHDAAPDAPVPEPTAAPDPELDGEVDAAFEEAHVKGSAPAPAVVVPVAEPTTELVLTPTVESLLNTEAAGDAGGFIDLGEWLRASEPSRSTRMVSDDVAPTGDESADFAEMLRRFKQGVAANVDDEDYASHYDLGVAFKEMGLIDEAIAEFQKALRGDDHRVRAYEALGQCFVEQQQYQVATTLLRRALESTRADDQRLVGVLYLLGYASETMGRHGDAVGYYQRVFAVDIEFRDVSSRLAALDRKTQ